MQCALLLRVASHTLNFHMCLLVHKVPVTPGSLATHLGSQPLIGQLELRLPLDQLVPLLPLLFHVVLQALLSQLRRSHLVFQLQYASLQVLHFLAGPAHRTRGVSQLLGEAGKGTRSRTYILSAVLVTGGVDLRERLVLCD